MPQRCSRTGRLTLLRYFPRGGSPDPPRKTRISAASAVGRETHRAECACRVIVLTVCGLVATAVCLMAAAASAGEAGDLIPPASEMQPGRPRLLLRARTTPHAVSLEHLRGQARDADFRAMLDQLRRQKAAHAQAMVYLLTGDEAAAEKAVRRMREYRCPERPDTFHIFYRLLEFGLAYDWLYDAPGVTPQVRAEIRRNVAPLAARGLRVSDDHVFHNYIWMSAGGVAVWAMATAGEDADADRLFEAIRTRFNRRLYPAWRYLDGLPSEPMGYWALYVFAPGVWTLLGAESAFETDLVERIRTEQDGWLDRHFANLVHSTLPNLRYLPWGDLQGGPNGGLTHEMASRQVPQVRQRAVDEVREVPVQPAVLLGADALDEV
ncbi:MAG: hypothetical protein R6X20_17275, partial [Phycisphaerae bacterium]